MDVAGLRDRLGQCYDVSDWWPHGSEWEVMVAAILVQQTSWGNVERVLEELKRRGALNIDATAAMPLDELERIVRPAGFYRQKASRLQNLARYLVMHHSSDPMRLLEKDIEESRAELLSLPGIGDEAADAILLFAGGRPKFIAAAYVRRLLDRTGLFPSDDYGEVQRHIESELPLDVDVYKEMYALMVHHSRTVCRARPRCQACCLRDHCEFIG